MSEDDRDECQIAFEAAMKKSAEYCGDQQSRLNVLGDILGIDGDEIDPETVLDAGPVGSMRTTREWVLARAEQKMERGQAPIDAVNEAWGEANQKIEAAAEEEEEAEQGPEHDDEEEEDEEAEAEEEEEDDLDEAIEELEEDEEGDDDLEEILDDEGEEIEVDAD